MTVKRFIILAVGMSFLLSVSAAPAFAENPDRNQERAKIKQEAIKKAQLEAAKAGDTGANKQVSSEDFKKHAAEGVQKRIEKIKQALAKVSASDSLSAEEKAQMTAQLQKELAELQALTTKINALTESNAVKEQVKLFKQAHGEYALHGPRISILHSAEKIMKLSDKMASFGAKIDSKLDAAETSGQNVSSQRAALSELTTKAASAKAKAQSVITTVNALTLDGTEANKNALTEAKITLRAAQGELKSAHKDIKNIVEGLSKTGTPTPSVSASE